MRKPVSAGLAIVVSACAESTSPERRMDFKPAATLSLAAPEAVLPSGYASIMGGTNQNFPHAGFRNMRYQQIFLGSDLVDPLIVGLCMRRDDVVGHVQREKTLTIKLGPSSLGPATLGASFDANYSAPPTEVFTGNVIIPASDGLGTPVDFDFCIPFTQAYEHPAGSNVILEVINTSLNLSDAPRDACLPTEAACTTARAFALSPTATTATLVDRQGVIVKFVSPEPPKPVDPVLQDECKLGGWSNFNFRNQGQCIRFVETGEDSRGAGGET